MSELKYLLPRKKYYKACLHTHSIISDGTLSPEEVKARYKELGYSIVALTDHFVMTNQQHLNDSDFLFLTAAEMNISAPERRGKNYHLNIISRDPIVNF